MASRLALQPVAVLCCLCCSPKVNRRPVREAPRCTGSCAAIAQVHCQPVPQQALDVLHQREYALILHRAWRYDQRQLRQQHPLADLSCKGLVAREPPLPPPQLCRKYRKRRWILVRVCHASHAIEGGCLMRNTR
jgi:hypothetical protein